MNTHGPEHSKMYFGHFVFKDRIHVEQGFIFKLVNYFDIEFF